MPSMVELDASTHAPQIRLGKEHRHAVTRRLSCGAPVQLSGPLDGFEDDVVA